MCLCTTTIHLDQFECLAVPTFVAQCQTICHKAALTHRARLRSFEGPRFPQGASFFYLIIVYSSLLSISLCLRRAESNADLRVWAQSVADEIAVVAKTAALKQMCEYVMQIICQSILKRRCGTRLLFSCLLFSL